MTTYTKNWFAGQVNSALTSADTVVPMITDLVHPVSVVDIGCGLGAWLAAFVKAGISDILGVDGDYVDRSMLKIPADKFQAHDLTRPLALGRRFDLATSFEVAEHLPPAVADQFVLTLTSLAPVVAFSAAVPGQGGNHHVNEQWQSYWADKFAARGYAVADPFRTPLWQNQSVEWWYRQNMLLYVSRERLAIDQRLRDVVERTAGHVLDVVHPSMFAAVHDSAAHPGRSLVRAQVVVAKQAIKKILP